MATDSRRLIILGIDSMDPQVVKRELHNLPNLRRMSEIGMMKSIESVFPPDSIPAWATIFTGLDPSEHGLVMTPDIFESSWMSILNIDVETYRGRTFWDQANRLGKRVFVWMPLGVYPPWKVDGTMISRSFEGDIRAQPESIMQEYDFSSLKSLKGNHPGRRNLLSFSKTALDLTEKEKNLALQISSEQDWNLGFFFFSSLDIIQHFFWRYYDKEDPTHKKNTELAEIIPRFYQFFDSLIGQFEGTYSDDHVMVLSDHGHGMRPPTTVNINEVLRRNGLLTPRGRRPYVGSKIRELFRFAVLEAAYSLELESLLLRFIKRLGLSSESKNLYLSEGSIDVEKSKAYLSTFAGPKSYPTGGIHVRCSSREEANRTKAEISRILFEIIDPRDGKAITEWISERDRLFQGENSSKYPDILFMLREEYGVYWSIFGPLFQSAYEHHLASGGHKMCGILASDSTEVSLFGQNQHCVKIQDFSECLLHALKNLHNHSSNDLQPAGG